MHIHTYANMHIGTYTHTAFPLRHSISKKSIRKPCNSALNDTFLANKNICTFIWEKELKAPNNFLKWQMDLWFKLYQCNENTGSDDQYGVFQKLKILLSQTDWLYSYCSFIAYENKETIYM